MNDEPTWLGVARRAVDQSTSVRAQRAWWDDQARDYYREHGDFLGDADLVWGPEGWHESQLNVLGDVSGLRVLEIGAGAAQGSRYLQSVGAQVVATDLSGGMLAQGRAINARRGDGGPPLIQCDGARLPFADRSCDVIFTAYGVMPFVEDAAGVIAEAARVLRPGGLLAFATTHPLRWALPDAPGAEGLTVTASYFDRTPYVEEDENGSVTYVEHHRTIGDWVSHIVGAGLLLQDVIEPDWPATNSQVWGGWSPMRGRLIPGTAIFTARRAERPA
ncbi:class I SAM-dependent methyltransferase [Demetria terragena]|uniref:class I SAM-dependent methyltransferase n=1 Tax=Demetria terragena TaxID=63959 RepID=UPI0012EA5175|nr:class I SAM-dependent methyltransferase [Demetria terragena]